MNKLIKRVVENNIYDKSVICCIEEMSELTKVLCKQQRKSDKFNRQKLTEELAHTLLMCNVLAVENNITLEEIEAEQLKAVIKMELESAKEG